MSILDDLYLWIQRNRSGKPTPLPVMYPHYVHYAQSLIEHKFNITYSLEQVQRIMYEEGLLPDEYYFSDWYIKKYKQYEQNI